MDEAIEHVHQGYGGGMPQGMCIQVSPKGGEVQYLQ
eukprot:CAMPEP_0202916070 /NCGR_PEP_ID=MMETSP1392-20130828/67555_1 /ASSEMBLY_ACC=CAM_ASM_000868 /TAXON_ID=225041 /ORGANISM="Chlamydomonas chlamydogama, Strain SAG 11-48b" /LENGTH=35 /DNA_ID= /DNA_START= /DNA_END= /DNA_ORIENTATION=